MLISTFSTYKEHLKRIQLEQGGKVIHVGLSPVQD